MYKALATPSERLNIKFAAPRGEYSHPTFNFGHCLAGEEPRHVEAAYHRFGPLNAAGRPLVPCIFYDRRDTSNALFGLIHRVGREMPTPKHDEISIFFEYGKRFVHRIPKIEDHDIPSVETWLRKSNYSHARQKYLASLMMDERGMAKALLKKATTCQSFVKWEPYMEEKWPRTINSYSDETKVLLGPYVHAMDKKLFSLKWFIKGSDPSKLPPRLLATFQDKPVIETDFTSFEAHHRGVFARLQEYYFNHMMRGTLVHRHIRRLLAHLVSGSQNVLQFRGFSASLLESLMSGALWTSSANGFMNLLFMSYLYVRALEPDCHDPERLVALAFEKFVGVIEGDDGMCLDVGQSESIARDLGLNLKFERKPNFKEAHFCGCECSADLERLRDPYEFLAKMFWLPPETRTMKATRVDALLRAKAVSYKYLHPDTPVIAPICDRILDLTKSITVNVDAERDTYKRELLVRALADKPWRHTAKPTLTARLEMERLYGMPCAQQISLEAGEPTPDLFHLRESKDIKGNFHHTETCMPDNLWFVNTVLTVRSDRPVHIKTRYDHWALNQDTLTDLWIWGREHDENEERGPLAYDLTAERVT